MISTLEEFASFLYVYVVPDQPVLIYDDTGKKNPENYGVFPDKQYCWYYERWGLEDGSNDGEYITYTLIFRPDSLFGQQATLYGSDLLGFIDSIADNNPFPRSRAVLQLYDHSLKHPSDWKTRSYLIGGDTVIECEGTNTFVLRSSHKRTTLSDILRGAFTGPRSGY